MFSRRPRLQWASRFWLWFAAVAVCYSFSAGSPVKAGLFDQDKAGTETAVLGTGPNAECRGQKKASIAISRFDNKSANSQFYRSGIGDGMADQLTTALVSTGCYKVVDRQNLKGAMDELGLQQSGVVDPGTASKVGRIVGADLIVTAAVTEFTDKASGSKRRAGGGGLLGNIGGVLGAIGNSTEKAHMAIDLRITDVQTSEIIGATAVEGKATDVKVGAAVGALLGGVGGLGALENWENTPRGAALREVIEKSVTVIYSMVPPGYFRHSVGRFGNSATNRNAAASGGPSSSQSPMLSKAQRALKDLGLYAGAVDGIMGPATSKALGRFQAEMNLEQTGTLNLKTMKAINDFVD